MIEREVFWHFITILLRLRTSVKDGIYTYTVFESLQLIVKFQVLLSSITYSFHLPHFNFLPFSKATKNKHCL